MKKICVITGSRAEYGLLRNLIKLMNDEKEIQVQLIATNMHLSPEFGSTYKEILNDGIRIDKKVHMLLSDDSPNATSKSVGLGIIGFADAFEDLSPDLLLVLGDRYEILAAVTSALFYKIPVIHLHGGEISEGAYDDSIRHAITKLSHIHFTSTEEYRKRVIQLGESPNLVFNFGAIGVDNIKRAVLLEKKELEESIQFKLDRNTLLVTYHPVTLSNESVSVMFQNLLDALDHINDCKIIFTMPNSDTNGRVIMQMIKNYVITNPLKSIWFESLGAIRYLSCLKYIGAVVGNSSSGIIEVPSFGIPTLNIGERQKGRIASSSVINCKSDKQSILKGLKMVFKYDQSRAVNPYEKEGTIENILSIIKNISINGIIQKSFYNL